MSRKLSKLIADFESSLVGRMLSDNPRTEKNYKDARKALSTALSEAEAALDDREIASGLTSNGNLWRFWADRAKGLAVKLSEAQQQVQDAKRIATNAEHYGYLHGLEKAAAIADEHMKAKCSDAGGETEAMRLGASSIAAMIRALIPSEPHDAEGRN